MKIQIYTIVIILTSLIVQDIYLGKYTFSNKGYTENIDLKEDNTFVYNLKQEFISYEIHGNYNIQNDSLILDSNPQRDKLIVKEFNKGNKKNTTIVVTDKLGNAIHYNLYLILEGNKKDSLKDQWQTSRIKNAKVKAFYFVDNKGLKSPVYFKKSQVSNYFEVLFETKRVFENEKWFIKDGLIIPRGLDGKLQDYKLKK